MRPILFAFVLVALILGEAQARRKPNLTLFSFDPIGLWEELLEVGENVRKLQAGGVGRYGKYGYISKKHNKPVV